MALGDDVIPALRKCESRRSPLRKTPLEVSAQTERKLPAAASHDQDLSKTLRAHPRSAAGLENGLFGSQDHGQGLVRPRALFDHGDLGFSKIRREAVFMAAVKCAGLFIFDEIDAHGRDYFGAVPFHG